MAASPTPPSHPRPFTRAGAMSSSPQDTDAFPQFARLPTELRLRIWNFNLPQTRLLPIQCGSDSLSLGSPSGDSTSSDSLPLPLPPPLPWTSGCTSTATIPVNLHVCTESRAEALKEYRLHFGFARGPGQVFFNPDRDIVYFGPRDGYMAADSQFHTYMSMCDPAELATLKRIAINDALFWIDRTYRSMTASSLTVKLLRRIQARMPAVQEIIFVPRDEESVDGPDAAYIESTMVHARMAHQIQTAFATLCEQTPQWKPPMWRIVPLRAFPKPYA